MKTKILNFGSVNIDYVYGVDHFVRPGETLSSNSFRLFCGGKGANQSIALALAGANIFHAGKIGGDGIWIREKLRKSGVNTEFLEISGIPTGHAVIQVNRNGENSIILYGGANRDISKNFTGNVLKHFSQNDYLLLQNEIGNIPEIIRGGAKNGMKIFFNPAPMHAEVLKYPLNLVDCFILNEIEGAEISGKTEIDPIISHMLKIFPNASVILTLGKKGAIYADSTSRIKVPALKVRAVDTTAAGDTFIGYLLAFLSRGKDIKCSLEMACKAAAICVTRRGASDSIPKISEVTTAGKRA